ncbi:hypothetical protein ERJ75_000332100 [Trypanosoma vivax]|uniref:Present in the outer mitochondrial membrane proteome 13 n=1 Tax=Trypanosoma vivax (strain Y486) TaxID=1055687 RepID=G0UAJ8_TRYVY|nr:hypothetical protein ERJ75_000332100 [Trypanosoma vivax]CCC52831.1 conserved hypothetical protein [Trypanosoma vivax Y486]
MTTLSSGAFVYVGGKGRHLYLLKEGPSEESCVIYGGEVSAFGFQEGERVIALSLPPSMGEERSVVRLYAFSDGELGEMLGEVAIATATATQLLWVEKVYLVACSPFGCSIFVWENSKLKVSATDKAVCSYVQRERLALLYNESRVVKFWDLKANKVLDSIKLSRQGQRLAHVMGSGYFSFALYDDGTLGAFYVTKTTTKKLQAFPHFFSGDSAMEPSGGAPLQLLVCALSSRKVVVGLHGGVNVHKLEYRHERLMSEKAREALPPGHTLVAFSADGRRCLALNTEKGKHCSLVLHCNEERDGVANDDGPPASLTVQEGSSSSKGESLAPSTAGRDPQEPHNCGAACPPAAPISPKTEAASSSCSISKPDSACPFHRNAVLIATAGVALLASSILLRRLLSHP